MYADNFPRPVSMTSGSSDGRCDAADGAGNDARQVEHLDARQRPLRRGHGPRRRLADLIDGEDGEAGNGAALWKLVPLHERAARGHDKAGLGGGGLQRLGAPPIERALHRRALVPAAEQGKHPVTMMGQIGMQPHPPAITAAIQSGDLVMMLDRRASIDAQVPFAAKLDRGAAHVDADALATTRAQSPQFARRQSRGANGRLRCATDRK
jgi:hypothetical protein